MNDLHTRLKQHWLVVATSSEVSRKPVARRILNTPIVLYRHHGKTAALLDRCPHRNAPLSSGKVEKGQIQCPYHGWRFSTEGKCTAQPGTAPDSPELCGVQVFDTHEAHGLIWCRLESNKHHEDAPQLPPWWSDSHYTKFTWVDNIDAEFVDAMENLLDATHTPFVHAGLVRSSSGAQSFRATVRARADCAEAEYADEGKQAGWISQIFERDRASSFGRYLPPSIAELEYTSRRGTEFVLNCHFTPETSTSVRIYSTFFIRRTKVPALLKRIVLTPFFRRVLKQDREILRLQQQNIRNFGGPQYHFWHGDLLRGYIESWLRNGQFPMESVKKDIEFKL